MNAVAGSIRRHLDEVEQQRKLRASDASLESRVFGIKHFQHQRFEHTYADLIADPRHAKAARFFLDELYGTHDFSERDAQFARIVPAIVRLFPKHIVSTVADLAELHALSETFDSTMARHLSDAQIDWPAYKAAWLATGQPENRARQIALMLKIGESLDAYTASPVLRHSLKLMRRPAKTAGLGELQSMLERGFDIFREMRGAAAFLETIAAREKSIAKRLFDLAEVEIDI